MGMGMGMGMGMSMCMIMGALAWAVPGAILRGEPHGLELPVAAPLPVGDAVDEVAGDRVGRVLHRRRP